jgi:hypothetical protein
VKPRSKKQVEVVVLETSPLSSLRTSVFNLYDLQLDLPPMSFKLFAQSLYNTFLLHGSLPAPLFSLPFRCSTYCDLIAFLPLLFATYRSAMVSSGLSPG